MQFDLFTYLLAQQNGGGGTGGSGNNYKSMMVNSDNTITVIDLEDAEHTIVPTYTDNIITAITYDGKNVKLVYDNNGNLTKIGDSNVDLENYPYQGGSNIGYQVTFKVDDDIYYISQCLQGGTITEPPTPSKSGYAFTAWQLSGADVSFPYTPSANTTLTAIFTAPTEYVIHSLDGTIDNNNVYGNLNYSFGLVAGDVWNVVITSPDLDEPLTIPLTAYDMVDGANTYTVLRSQADAQFYIIDNAEIGANFSVSPKQGNTGYLLQDIAEGTQIYEVTLTFTKAE